MSDPIPGNNEFKSAENALMKLGSNMWFSGLSERWQDFMTSNTVECFDTYDVTMEKAAEMMIGVFQKVVSSGPSVLQIDPWTTVMTKPE